MIFQFVAIIRDRFTGQPLRDHEGRVTSHLSGLLSPAEEVMLTLPHSFIRFKKMPRNG
jgi:hypothetical protein